MLEFIHHYQHNHTRTERALFWTPPPAHGQGYCELLLVVNAVIIKQDYKEKA